MNEVKATIATLASNNVVESKEVLFRSDVKPSAANKGRQLKKFVIGRYIIGQEYQPTDGNSEGSGDPRSLPWGEWKSYPYVIQHNNAEYLRLTPCEDDKPMVRFEVDGNEVTREKFAEYLTPANARKLQEKKKVDCLSVKLENICSIR